MKKLIVCITALAVSLILLSAPIPAAAGEKTVEWEGKLVVGVHGVDYDGFKGRVSPYEVFKDPARPHAGAKIKGRSDEYALDIFGYIYDEDNAYVGGAADLKRLVRARASYIRYIHQLDHDPLANLHAVSTAKVVTETDFDPDADYMINYSRADVDARLTLPLAQPVRIGFEYDQQDRDGHKQSQTISHCAYCHITSKGREINERTKQFRVSAEADVGILHATYAYTTRDFKDKGATPTNTYDDVRHPSTHAPVFDNRIQYDSADGALPYEMVPDSEKNSHVMRVKVDLPGTGAADGHYVKSESTNLNANIKADFEAYGGAVHLRPFKNARLTAQVRQEKMTSDDYYVQSVERTSVAGPQAGKTYRDVYGFDPNFTRESAYDRDVTSAKFNLRYRIPERRMTLSGGYEREQTDRATYEVADNSTETTMDRIRFSLNARLDKKLRARFMYRGSWYEHPFVNLYGGCETHIQDVGVSSPLVPGSTQYYERHGTRAAHLTNFPSDLHEMRAVVTWTPDPRFAFTGAYRFSDAKNDELNLSEFKRSIHSPELTAWYAPGEGTTITSSYIYFKTNLNTMTCIPVMDG
ncbi:GSU2204 family CXXCH-containing (seleno)protein [Acidobacteriota bacterium]